MRSRGPGRYGDPRAGNERDGAGGDLGKESLCAWRRHFQPPRRGGRLLQDFAAEVADLRVENPLDGVLHRGAEGRARSHRRDERVPRALLRDRRVGDQDHVVAGLQRPPACLRGVQAFRQHSLHLHVVGDHQSFEPELAAEHVAKEERGKGGRGEITGDLREGQVARHDRGDPLPNQDAVRDEIAAQELFQADVDARQMAVGILVRRSVARKVLGRAQDAGVRHPSRVSGGQQARRRRVRSERTRTYDARLRIGIHVGRGREVHVDAERRQLPAEVVAGAVSVRGDARGAEGEVARGDRRLVLDLPDPAALLVRGDEQRDVKSPAERKALHGGNVPRKRREVRNVPREDLHTADLAG